MPFVMHQWYSAIRGADLAHRRPVAGRMLGKPPVVLSRQAFSEQDAKVIEAQQTMMADPDTDTSRPALFDVDIGATRYERHLEALLAAN